MGHNSIHSTEQQDILSLHFLMSTVLTLIQFEAHVGELVGNPQFIAFS